MSLKASIGDKLKRAKSWENSPSQQKNGVKAAPMTWTAFSLT